MQPVHAIAADGVSPTGRPRARHDWYLEPAWCTEALLDVERPGGVVWDPACGVGTIVKVCQARGIDAVGSDIADRGFGGVQDFLDPNAEFVGIDCVISNPPYDAKVALQFIWRALAVARDRVMMLLPLPFLCSERRHAFFGASPVARIYVLSSRPSMPPGELLVSGKVKASGGKEDYCWIVWQHGWHDAPVLRWLRKPERSAS